MTARELLDAYAATTVQVEDDSLNVEPVRLDAVAPKVFAALRAVLDPHEQCGACETARAIEEALS